MLVILLGATALSFSAGRDLMADELRAHGQEAAAALAMNMPSLRQYIGTLAALILGAGLVWAAFVIALVRWLQTRVLAEVANQVRAMRDAPPLLPAATAATRDATTPTTQWSPAVAELADLTEAVNETREHLRVTAVEQHARIESLTAALNQDPLTRLVNRRFFMNALRVALQSTTPDYGHVLVWRQRDLAALNRHMPRDFTDQWLRTTAQRLSQLIDAADESHLVLARLNGSDFALLMPGLDTPLAAAKAERVRQILRESRLPVGEDGMCRWALALVRYAQGDTLIDLLAALDHALMRSESTGDENVVVGDEAPAHIAAGEFAWKDTLITALEENRYFLNTTPLYALDKTLLRHEATLMLQAQAKAPPVPPELFVPAAVRLGLSAQCDIQAVRLGLDWLGVYPANLCVRVSTPSLAQSDFLPRLVHLLTDRETLAKRLVLEIDAHALAAHYPKALALATALQRAGVRLGLRRLAQQFSAVGQLHHLPLSYLRLGGAFVAGLPHSPGSRLLATSIMQTASELGLDVYADDVPDAGTGEILAQMGVKAMRGPGLSAAGG